MGFRGRVGSEKGSQRGSEKGPQRGSEKGLSRRHLEGKNMPLREYNPLRMHPM